MVRRAGTDTETPTATDTAPDAEGERVIRAVNAPPADVAPLPAHPDPSTPHGGRAAPARGDGLVDVGHRGQPR